MKYEKYNFYREQQEKQAMKDGYAAFSNKEAAKEKEATLAEVQSFVDGERELSDLSPDTQEMLEAAAAGRPRYDINEYRAKWVHDEVFDIVPGLVKEGVQSELPKFTLEEFEERCCSYENALRYEDLIELSFGASLRIDQKELRLLNEMWRLMNDERQRIVDEKMKDLPLLADGVLSARYVDSLSGGQSYLAANVEGFDPNKEHSTFSDAVVSVFNAGGHTFAAGNDAGVIQLPQAPEAKKSDEVYEWDGCVSPKKTRQSISFGGVGLSAPVFTETSGTLVAFQIGKEHLRVTFVEKKGAVVKPDAALYEALRQLAKLFGIDFPSDTSPTWVKNEKDSTTWDYNVGGR